MNISIEFKGEFNSTRESVGSNWLKQTKTVNNSEK